MIFDTPLLLVLAPVVALAPRVRGVAGAAAGASALARPGRPRSASWRAAAADGRPIVPRGGGAAGVVGLAGPRWAPKEIRTETRALDLVFAVDISRSMLAEDVAPNRLQRAVREARRLVQDLDGDRLGLIAFAGQSYILAPLTVDGGAIRMYLDALDPDIATPGGTNLAPALNQGGQLLGATTDARRPGAGRCSPTARRTTRCRRSWRRPRR